MNQIANPLRQYFRQPAIYLRLPSGGAHWAAGSLDMPANGELPVLPMTAIDEITYRTPDALFNGQAVINVIQSCIPNIKNAWAAPGPDINAILTAIRIASYGHDLEIGSKCPNCGTESDYTIDLRNVLDQLKCPSFAEPLSHGDLTITFQPITYKTQNETNQAQFEEQKVMQLLPASDLPEQEKLARMHQVLQKITELTVKSLKWSIQSIRTPQAIVSEPEFIEDFLKNCDRALFNEIRDKVINLRLDSEIKPLKIQCIECDHQYDQPMTLDMTSFFAPAS
jgi:hypothetical protein